MIPSVPPTTKLWLSWTPEPAWLVPASSEPGPRQFMRVQWSPGHTSHADANVQMPLCVMNCHLVEWWNHFSGMGLAVPVSCYRLILHTHTQTHTSYTRLFTSHCCMHTQTLQTYTHALHKYTHPYTHICPSFTHTHTHRKYIFRRTLHTQAHITHHTLYIHTYTYHTRMYVPNIHMVDTHIHTVLKHAHPPHIHTCTP